MSDVKFEHRVTMTSRKSEFDNLRFNDSRLKWCINNFGRPAIVDPSEGNWSRTFDYAHYGTYIDEFYTFKESDDAIMFALRWKNVDARSLL